MWSQPQELDMSGNAELSRKACSGNEAVCLVILGTSLPPSCLFFYFILDPPEMRLRLSITLSVLHLWSPSLSVVTAFLFALSTCRCSFYQPVSPHISSGSLSFLIRVQSSTPRWIHQKKKKVQLKNEDPHCFLRPVFLGHCCVLLLCRLVFFLLCFPSYLYIIL